MLCGHANAVQASSVGLPHFLYYNGTLLFRASELWSPLYCNQMLRHGLIDPSTCIKTYPEIQPPCDSVNWSSNSFSTIDFVHLFWPEKMKRGDLYHEFHYICGGKFLLQSPILYNLDHRSRSILFSLHVLCLQHPLLCFVYSNIILLKNLQQSRKQQQLPERILIEFCPII